MVLRNMAKELCMKGKCFLTTDKRYRGKIWNIFVSDPSVAENEYPNFVKNISNSPGKAYFSRDMNALVPMTEM